MAGASTSLSNVGSVAGPAGGQATGSSASAAAAGPSMPSGGSIHPSSAARLPSSRELCPVAQCSRSTSVIASSSELPGWSWRSVNQVSHRPSAGTAASTAYGPSVRRNRVERPSIRRNATPPRLGTSSCGASL
ncbi:hypothetical protein [Actinomadura keratinilytica]|uniref:hypothetical protein n=1 Tax=Actinomadura keratinilytica TaxID=547461 RepID=UPI0036199139